MPVKIKELPESERPYEKLEKYGEKMLTNAELLAIIIKTGTKEETSVGLAQRILQLNEDIEKDNLNFLRDITIQELMKIKGIGKVKAIQIKALCEFSNRMNTTVQERKTKITRPSDVAELLMKEMRFEKQEILKVVILDGKNNVIKIKDVAKGSGNFVVATIKSVLNEAVKVEAPKIILVHNHPGGDPTPSNEDFEFTIKVEKAAQILGIELLDHIVIGKLKYISIISKMRER